MRVRVGVRVSVGVRVGVRIGVGVGVRLRLRLRLRLRARARARARANHVRPPHQPHRCNLTQHLSPLRQAPVGRWVASVDVVTQLQAIVPRPGARRRLLYLDQHDRRHASLFGVQGECVQLIE